MHAHTFCQYRRHAHVKITKASNAPSSAATGTISKSHVDAAVIVRVLSDVYTL
jgi:hypothetical protein